MEWKYLFLILAYSLTACDSVLGASTIINVTLVDGETPNEGRVEFLRSDASSLESPCGNGIKNSGASVICRELGYPGVNNLITVSPFGTSSSLADVHLNCDGTEDNLADCLPLVQTSFCSHAGGVICYESGYIGCYLSVPGELQIPCENGVQDLTIPKCVSLCRNASDIYTYAGLHRGNMCICWSASTTASPMDKKEDRMCSSPCDGRDIEKCGGDSQIALFNISLYLQNTKRIASPPGCAQPTTTQTEDDDTTTVSIRSPSTSSKSSSPPPKTSSMPSTKDDRTTMGGDVSSTSVTSSSSSYQTTRSTTAQTTIKGVNSPTNNQTDQTSPGLYIGVGAGGGILLLIIIILLVVFIIRRRRSQNKGSSGDLNMRSLHDGSDLGDFPPLPISPNNYSLENGHTNMAANDLTTGTGVEDSDDALIAETDMNQVNSARNGSTYGDVLRLENTSGSHRPPQPAPRKSTKDTQFTMHPVHELYTTPDESQMSNGHRDSIPENAVSQKFRKEPISQAVPQAPPSALGPEDINGLYTMPDKSRNMTKAKKVLASDMDRPSGIDNALYVCRGEDSLQEGETSNEYATDNDGMETGGEDESDGDTGMVENELYETSYRPT